MDLIKHRVTHMCTYIWRQRHIIWVAEKESKNLIFYIIHNYNDSNTVMKTGTAEKKRFYM